MRFSISLRPKDIRDYSSLKTQVDGQALERFKRLTEGGCIPLHLPAANRQKVAVEPGEGRGRVLPRLYLPEDIRLRADEIVAYENRKLEEAGIMGGWIDGGKLAVRSISVSVPDNRLSLGVSSLRWSEILAMGGLPFEEIADYGALKLDTNTHVLARHNDHDILLVGHRGRKPGEPRMGDIALLAPAKENTQWTLATNGTVDADVMCSIPNPEDIWIANSLREFKEELGMDSHEKLSYLGLIVDPKMFVGALGIVGVIETDLSPYEVDEARKRAKYAVEVPVLDTIPLEKDTLATYLRVNRSNMVPQLVTSIVMLGYSRWGSGFLELADK
ncbi:MAG: hypothetical protein V1861_03370 [Candidatus Micrarchaeota archaeon]